MKLRSALLWATGWVMGIWVVFLAENYTPLSLYAWLGIAPRSWQGIVGIFGWVFAHGSWEHLLANTPPLWILSAALLYLYRPISGRVLALVWLLSGAWVWLFAVGGRHIGASGVIYGLAAFLVLSGILRKHRKATVLAFGVAFFYGNMVWGVLPIQAGVSWEGHLFGALAGLLAAFIWRKEGLTPETPFDWQETDDDPNEEGAWNYRKHFPEKSAE